MNPSQQGVYIGGAIFGPILHWFVRTTGLSRLIFWLLSIPNLS
jgi:hypothetical protein